MLWLILIFAFERFERVKNYCHYNITNIGDKLIIDVSEANKSAVTINNW